MKIDLKRGTLIAVSLAFILFFKYLTPPAGMTQSGMQVVGIFIGVLLLWLFESIDWPSCLAIAALAFVPGQNMKGILASSLGSETIAFLLFTFLCTYELSKTTFIRRVAIWFIDNNIARKNPWRFTSLLFASILVLGLFISPTVLFIIYFPILEEIYLLLGLKKGDKAAALLMMGLVFICGISSGMTPIAHVFPLIAMGIYEKVAGITIDYGSYMLMAIPVGIASMIAMFAMFRFVFKPDMSKIENLDVSSLRKDIPEITNKEKVVLAVFSLVVILWVLPSLTESILPSLSKYISSFGISMPPILGVIALSIFTDNGKPILNFKDAMSKGVPWASIIICSAALAIGAVMTNKDIGLTAYLGSAIGPVAASLSPMLVIFVFLMWSAVQTNLSSNIVTATVVTTIATPILLKLPGINGAAVASMIGMLASYAFATPPAMPSVAIAGGSGWTNTKELFLYGSLLMVLSVLISLFIGYPIGAAIMR